MRCNHHNILLSWCMREPFNGVVRYPRANVFSRGDSSPSISGTTALFARGLSPVSTGRNGRDVGEVLPAAARRCSRRRHVALLLSFFSLFFSSLGAPLPSRRRLRVACHIINRRGSGCCAVALFPSHVLTTIIRRVVYTYLRARSHTISPRARAQWNRIWI